MKQMAFWLVLAALVSALGLWPTKAHDAAELLPAQVLVVDASSSAAHRNKWPPARILTRDVS